jgi:hypothetical protein
MAGIEPSRLAVHHPRVWLCQRVGIAVYGVAVVGDGGEGDDGKELQLEQLSAGSGKVSMTVRWAKTRLQNRAMASLPR